MLNLRFITFVVICGVALPLLCGCGDEKTKTKTDEKTEEKTPLPPLPEP